MGGVVLETDRLMLTPLSVDQLKLWLTDIPALEAELDCSYQAEPIEGFFAEIVRGQAKKTVADAAATHTALFGY